jgi:hypothetical protein
VFNNAPLRAPRAASPGSANLRIGILTPPAKPAKPLASVALAKGGFGFLISNFGFSILTTGSPD